MLGIAQYYTDAVPTLFQVPNPPPMLESKRRPLKRRISADDNSESGMPGAAVAADTDVELPNKRNTDHDHTYCQPVVECPVSTSNQDDVTPTISKTGHKTTDVERRLTCGCTPSAGPDLLTKKENCNAAKI